MRGRLAILLLLASGCDTSATLLVDLKTDWVAGQEVATVRIAVEQDGAVVATQDTEVSSETDLIAPAETRWRLPQALRFMHLARSDAGEVYLQKGTTLISAESPLTPFRFILTSALIALPATSQLSHAPSTTLKQHSLGNDSLEPQTGKGDQWLKLVSESVRTEEYHFSSSF